MYPTDEAAEAWLGAALAEYSATRDPDLRAKIVDATSWLALRGARRFLNRGEPFDDLYQVAQIGLLNAIERFDPTYGAHFAAFATPTILGELRRHFRDHTWSVRVPRRVKDLRPAVNRALDELSKELGRSPRFDEIAAAVNASEEAVLEALEANHAYRAESLDTSESTMPSAADASYDTVLDRDLIAGLLERLRPRERMIVHLRFFEELSQAQIAERIGTSQVHVSRLLASTMVQLRRVTEAEAEADAAADAAVRGAVVDV